MNKSLEYCSPELLIEIQSICTDQAHKDAAQLHYESIHQNYIKEVSLCIQSDEDLEKESVVEAQETAGFHELAQRLAIGGHFNHLLLWSVRRRADKSLPSGKLLEQIEKQFTSFEGFKESFKKAVASRVLPGWVWLGVGKSKPDLIITQTNNEDNPLMAGVAEPQCTPIFGIDLWEHAYFTQYHGNKENYSSAFFDELDWNKLSYNYEEFNLKGQMAPLF